MEGCRDSDGQDITLKKHAAEVGVHSISIMADKVAELFAVITIYIRIFNDVSTALARLKTITL